MQTFNSIFASLNDSAAIVKAFNSYLDLDLQTLGMSKQQINVIRGLAYDLVDDSDIDTFGYACIDIAKAFKKMQTV